MQPPETNRVQPFDKIDKEIPGIMKLQNLLTPISKQRQHLDCRPGHSHSHIRPQPVEQPGDFAPISDLVTRRHWQHHPLHPTVKREERLPVVTQRHHRHLHILLLRPPVKLRGDHPLRPPRQPQSVNTINDFHSVL